MNEIDREKDPQETTGEHPTSLFGQEDILEPHHPGWQNLGQVFKPKDPFFEKFHLPTHNRFRHFVNRILSL